MAKKKKKAKTKKKKKTVWEKVVEAPVPQQELSIKFAYTDDVAKKLEAENVELRRLIVDMLLGRKP